MAAAAMLVAGAACGTRLPDSAFTSSGSLPASPTASPGASVNGVTSTSITIGTIASLTNLFDPAAFAGPSYGLRAFIDDVNRSGGINGRRLVLKVCDDKGNGAENVSCVHRLIEQDRVFALVSSAILDYAGAKTVNDAAVPDIGAQPIDLAYTKYPHLWDVTGESYPRNGEIGWHGQLRGGTETYRFFKDRFPGDPLRAGVVYFNELSSKAYADSLTRGLRTEGYTVVRAQVNFALPDYDSVAIKFRQAGVRYVYDAIDRLGNERLCKAMDENRLFVRAKVSTTQAWNADVLSDYRDSPRCRNSLYVTGGVRSFDAAGVPEVQRFRQAMARLGWDEPGTMSAWALEGWAGAQWFADAAASCGKNLTRACVERYMGRAVPYDARGLLLPRTFTVGPAQLTRHLACVNVARWEDTMNGGRGGWAEQVADMKRNCFVVPDIGYRP